MAALSPAHVFELVKKLSLLHQEAVGERGGRTQGYFSLVLWPRVSPSEIKVLAGAASALGSSEKDLLLSSLVRLMMGGSFCACWVEGLSSSLTVGYVSNFLVRPASS